MSSVDNEQLNNIVQDAVNATANAHQKYIDALERRLKDKDAEIERLKDRLSKLQCSYDCELNYRKELHKTAKADAIKEFEEMSEPKLIALYNKYHNIANKPKKETDMYYQGRAEAIWECISINRNLVKEMVGDAL
jgi:predicted RNase H-like nuclease (RuvC/YqgF family)